MAPPAYPTLKESWGALGWLLLISLPVGGVALAAGGRRAGAATLSQLVGLVLASELTLVLTIWWVRRRAGPLRWPGFALWGPREQWQLYALLPALVLAQVILRSPVALLHLPSPNDELYHELARYPALLLGLGGLAAPVLEELLFRGVLLKGLLRNYRPAVAIGQSALLFGLLHLSPAQSISTALLGLLLGWLYYRTQSLGLCIGLHMLNNLLAFSGMHRPKLARAQNVLDVISPGYYAAVLLAAAAVLAGIIWWVQRTPPPVLAPLPEASAGAGEALALPCPDTAAQ